MSTGLNIMKVMQAGQELKQQRQGQDLMKQAMTEIQSIETQPVAVDVPKAKQGSMGISTTEVEPSQPVTHPADSTMESFGQQIDVLTKYAAKAIGVGDKQTAADLLAMAKVKQAQADRLVLAEDKKLNRAMRAVKALINAHDAVMAYPTPPVFEAAKLDLQQEFSKSVADVGRTEEGDFVVRYADGRTEAITPDKMAAMKQQYGMDSKVKAMSPKDVRDSINWLMPEIERLRVELQDPGIDRQTAQVKLTRLKDLNAQVRSIGRNWNHLIDTGLDFSVTNPESEGINTAQTLMAGWKQNAAAQRDKDMPIFFGAGKVRQRYQDEISQIDQWYQQIFGEAAPDVTSPLETESMKAEPTQGEQRDTRGPEAKARQALRQQRQQGLDTEAPQETQGLPAKREAPAAAATRGEKKMIAAGKAAGKTVDEVLDVLRKANPGMTDDQIVEEAVNRGYLVEAE